MGERLEAIVFTGDAGNNRPQGHIQDIPSGIPRPITPEGVVLAAKAAVREDTSVLGQSGNRWALYPIEDGGAQPGARDRRNGHPDSMER